MNWTNAGLFLEDLSEAEHDHSLMFSLNKWPCSDLLVKGNTERGGQALVLVNISLNGVAWLPAVLLYV